MLLQRKGEVRKQDLVKTRGANAEKADGYKEICTVTTQVDNSLSEKNGILMSVHISWKKSYT